MFIPDCNNFRQKITYWMEPIVKFPGAFEVSELGQVQGALGVLTSSQALSAVGLKATCRAVRVGSAGTRKLLL